MLSHPICMSAPLGQAHENLVDSGIESPAATDLGKLLGNIPNQALQVSAGEDCAELLYVSYERYPAQMALNPATVCTTVPHSPPNRRR